MRYSAIVMIFFARVAGLQIINSALPKKLFMSWLYIFQSTYNKLVLFRNVFVMNQRMI